MIYSSLLFVYIFFPFSLLVYYVTPKKYRNTSLLVLSMIFCSMFGIGFLLFMIAYTALNYAACILISKYRSNKGISVSVLGLALLLDVLIIFIFRSDFFSIYKELLSISRWEYLFLRFRRQVLLQTFTAAEKRRRRI